MPSANDDGGEEESKPVDLKLVLNLLSYALGSVRRHKAIAATLFAVIFGGTVLALAVMPKTYHVETTLFAQRNSALALKGDQQSEGPNHSAPETIMRRENIVGLIRQTDLVHEWYKRRAPISHFKDVLMAALHKPETEAETVQWMADVLEKKMNVSTQGEGTIVIAIDWPDPLMAVRLVEAAGQSFLEARRATEVTAISEQIHILQNHAAALREEVDATVDSVESFRAKRLGKLPSSAPATASSSAAVSASVPAAPGPPEMPATASSSPPEGTSAAVAPGSSGAPASSGAPGASSGRPAASASPVAAAPSRPRVLADPEIGRLRTVIEAKQRAINDLEEFRRRRLLELNASLAEKSATYTDQHPIIIDLRKNIAALSTESPEVPAMRADIEALQKELDERLAAEDDVRGREFTGGSGRGSGTPPPLPGSIIRIEQEPSDERDPEMVYARGQLHDAMEKYASLRAQIETAQIDYDTAQAAFKYRYSVIDPPLYPKGPSKPKGQLVTLAGLAGGVLISIFIAVAMDLRRGRFVARWQVERSLDLPILAEMDVALPADHRIE